ncbi:hypothetical protein QYS36_11265 [Pseudomonas sp. G34]|uniref:hypothetical protein n=1 Tax=Pseudomonas sp. G34 TaxID=3059083 RepID=UPI002806A8C4|nr:hypothetical protein [Pseudomonas sp. G34]MDQ7985513.1 hypothetical protein [Pseudomonas sp. G34]
MYEKFEEFGGCLQIKTSEKTDFDSGLLEIMPRIEDVEADLSECKEMLKEISEEQSRLLLTTGFRRGLAYSSYTYMPLSEAQGLANEFMSSLPEGATFYTHCSIPGSEEGVVCGWSGRITGATFELSVYAVSGAGCTLFLITDED